MDPIHFSACPPDSDFSACLPVHFYDYYTGSGGLNLVDIVAITLSIIAVVVLL